MFRGKGIEISHAPFEQALACTLSQGYNLTAILEKAMGQVQLALSHFNNTFQLP
jgi:hypothetical protein